MKNETCRNVRTNTKEIYFSINEPRTNISNHMYGLLFTLRGVPLPFIFL